MDAERVRFADMEELGRNPGRIISAWRDFLAAHAGSDGAPLGIGEPAWHGRTDAELVECDRHEALLNVAFDGSREWLLLCPYDAARLPDDVLDAARRNHPHLVEHGGRRPSGAYARTLPGDEPLPAPEDEPAVLTFGREDLPAVREPLTRAGRRAGVAAGRIADLVLAVDELATSSVRYAAGRGTVRTWQESGTLLCEVADGGHIADPLAGRTLPGPHEPDGRGRGWSISSATWCSCARRRPGASSASTCGRTRPGLPASGPWDGGSGA